MSAADLVRELHGRGVILRRDGQMLRVKPTSKITAAELAHLTEHKAEILRLLASPVPAAVGRLEDCYAFPWPNSVPDLGSRRVQALSPCADCGAGSWVVYGEMVLCLVCAKRRRTGVAT